MHRSIAPLSIVLYLALAGTVIAAESESPAAHAELAAAPSAPQVAPVPPPIVVDPGAGTVTPAPGTLPDRVTTDPAGFAQTMITAIRGGQWRLLAAGILAALMVLGVRLRIRLFGAKDRGKAAAVMVLALLGATSAVLADVAPLSAQLFVGAITVAFTSVGGRRWLSALLWPADGDRQWLVWLKPWLGVQAPKAPAETNAASSSPVLAAR